jgi:hypothetical protein
MSKQPNTHRGSGKSQAFVTFLNPFCIIRPDKEPNYAVPLDEINNNTYNHGQLCRIVASIPVPQLKGTPLLICADGAIAAPITSILQTRDDLLDTLNSVMCSLLLGGHLCEAIDTRDIVCGSLLEDYAVWPTDLGGSLNARLHILIRMRIASNLDRIRLVDPKNIPVSRFFQQYRTGNDLLTKLPNVSPTLLLRGVTEMRYHNLTDALSNLWIVVEQLTELLWQDVFLARNENHPIPDIPNRRRSLDEDTRTWSMSVKHELLFQKKIISAAVYAKIHPARKARNDLVHKGLRPNADLVENLFSGILDLVHSATGSDPSDLRAVDMRIQDVTRSQRGCDLKAWNNAANHRRVARLADFSVT